MALPLFINLDDGNKVVIGQRNLTPVGGIRLKGGSATSIDFRFVRSGQVISLGSSPVFRFGAKPENQRDTDPILETLNDGFSVIDSDPADYHVRMALNTKTAALWDLFAVDADPENDVLIVRLDAELFWETIEGEFRTAQGFSLIMDNPVIRDSDLPPLPDDVEYPDPNIILKIPDIGDTVAGLTDGKVPRINIENWATVPGKPSDDVTPADIGDLAIEATSDTEITIKLKGSDGIVRSTILTLA